MKKIVWILGVGLLVMIIVISVGVGLYIGPIVKIGMEELGPKITQVSVKVDEVGISLLTGSVQVKGLVVGNPDGYKMPQSISVGNVAVSIDPFSVLSKKIVVHAVQVKSPEITFEGGLNGNNLSKIMNNVNAQAQKGSPAGSDNSSSTNNESNNKSVPKIEVDDFLITGAKVHVSLTGLVSKEMTLPLPDIHLVDLGKGSNGLTPVELTRAILDAIMVDTVKVVTSSVTELGQGVQNLGEGAGQTVGQSVNQITKSLGGLFGK